jgi:Flp pilus assembly protein TadB
MKTEEVILSILFLIYLTMGYSTPKPIAELVDTTVGKIIVLVIAIFVFSRCSLFLGVLAILVAFHFIYSSTVVTGNYALQHYVPDQRHKDHYLNAQHQFPYTLEQEVVKKMTVQYPRYDNDNYSFHAIASDTSNAAPLY